MQKVLSTIYPFELEVIASVLDEAGIPYDILTPSSGGGYGGGVQEIWVQNEEDYSKARELIDSQKESAVSTAPGWICPACGERNDDELTACCKCQYDVIGSGSQSEPSNGPSTQLACPRCGSTKASLSSGFDSWTLWIASFLLLGIPLFVHMFFEMGRGREFRCKSCKHKFRSNIS